ncbi:MAG: flagellar motor protein MotB [Spirochaetaceae bacterium]|nr:flagellar motor protein MotB [Spirochaetaceae bacterium]MBP3450084.1 flagellar motor protein MotB [Spirochaetaceae bacterium]MBQ3025194.1 flagellar motor protein MotB [Spirochaetaceae bacterium]MBQ7904198.1 flagellar motor protein MotB [Spirochaetaceae bacterium]
MGKKEPKKASQEWLTTYGDMITLMLCFFVMLYNPTEADPVQMAMMTASLQTDSVSGGMSATSGRLADLGNSINSLPSLEKGKNLGTAKKKAVSLFAPDRKSTRITITSDERGLVITLAADAFFAENSAELNIEETRDTLLRIAQFLSMPELAGRKFRIEGHTDSTTADSTKWPSNWELSSARAVNVLHYLSDFGIDESQFSVAGYADNQPRHSNDTPDGRAYNRRVDIIILDEGHF